MTTRPIFQPRSYQWPLLSYLRDGMAAGGQRAALVWHRRAGKDLTALNWTIPSAFTRVGIYYHLLPTYNQGRKIIWDGRDRDGNGFLDYWPADKVANANATEMKLNLTNGSLWQVVGSDDVDRIVGTNPVGCVFSEYSLHNPNSWEYLRPILRENGGWALFLFTPRGRNHAYDLYQMATRNPGWHTEILTVDDTNVVTPEEIQAERDAGMGEEMIQQEFYCSFQAPLSGSYWGALMDKARKEGRICPVPYDPALATHTFWDLGVDDYTAIWFVQFAGLELHVVDYYEMSGEGLATYARVLEERARKYDLIYGQHWAPHDIEARELGLGQSRRQTAKELGIDFNVVKISAFRSPGRFFVQEGIESVRNLLNRCWFDEDRCRLGISRLENYRKAWQEKHHCFAPTPLHDENSHGADAFRTLAMALKLGAGKVSRPTLDRYERPRKSMRKSTGWAA